MGFSAIIAPGNFCVCSFLSSFTLTTTLSSGKKRLAEEIDRTNGVVSREGRASVLGRVYIFNQGLVAALIYY